MDVHDAKKIAAETLGLHYIDNRGDWPLHCCCGAEPLNWVTHREHQADAVLAAFEAKGIVLTVPRPRSTVDVVVHKDNGETITYEVTRASVRQSSPLVPLESLPESEK